MGARTNALGLAAEITDPVLRDLIDRLGLRHGTIPRLPGTIDQAVDSTDVLSDPERFRAAGPLLGLPPGNDRGQWE